MLKNKYDISICMCGRIHVREWHYNWLADDHKNRAIVNICANCGRVKILKLVEDESMCANGFRLEPSVLMDGELDFEGTTKISLSEGISVFMKSGKVANLYARGNFVNTSELPPHTSFTDIHAAHINRADWAMVDTERLINDIESSYDDKSKSIIHAIKPYCHISWDGTKYK